MGYAQAFLQPAIHIKKRTRNQQIHRSGTAKRLLACADLCITELMVRKRALLRHLSGQLFRSIKQGKVTRSQCCFLLS